MHRCPVCGGTRYRLQRGSVAMPYECVTCAERDDLVMPAMRGLVAAVIVLLLAWALGFFHWLDRVFP